ncbi:MAG: SDR family oxidoreductase [Phenylobacterium sp.]|nr:SDR family oxidoreductase [Phenylobacterium sp.]
MKDFTGKIAVITGGGDGMGRELARQLVAQGCSVAICDVSRASMAETLALIAADRPPQGVRATAHQADVSAEADLMRFRTEVSAEHDTDHIHLLFNNAGIGAGGSLFTDSREAWDRTFNVCWGGVYLGVRTFLPMLQAAEAAHIVNTSSVNGLWGSLGPNVPHTAYVAAKFAVRGFTEALITDLRVNAPHIRCSVVMPGHIGTPIIGNTRRVLSGREDATPDLAAARARAVRAGRDPDQFSTEELLVLVAEQQRRFEEDAPTTAAEAATRILEGVKADRWRILVGDDAHGIDRLVREDPEAAYDPSFFETLKQVTGWRLGR